MKKFKNYEQYREERIFYDSILLPMKTNNLVASVDSETLKKILVYYYVGKK